MFQTNGFSAFTGVGRTRPERRSLAHELIDELAARLDVAESRYADARRHYEAVGKWLADDPSLLGACEPKIFPQGSTALGTMVRPSLGGSYDVDAVCRLTNVPEPLNPEELKALVGDRLKAHMTYARLLEPEGRRCWTLQYADTRFHLDVLPAIPADAGPLLAQRVEERYAREALSITDRNQPALWLPSNPRGYALWFKDQSEGRLRDVRLRKGGEVVPLDAHETRRLPLQRVVQLLKRHRDLMFAGDAHRPISMVITTLAAQSYGGHDSVFEALVAILPALEVALAEGGHHVRNPVNPEEVFTDKWNEVPAKRRAFMEWLATISSLCREITRLSSIDRIGNRLAEFFGGADVEDAMERLEARHTSPIIKGGTVFDCRVACASSPPLHKELPPWPMRTTAYRADVSGWYGVARAPYREGETLARGTGLLFRLSTNVPRPFDVRWQVVNTGSIAARKRQLRGTIEPSRIAGVGGVNQVEELAEFSGTHTIEAYVVKDGECVAHSHPLVVRVA